MGRLIFLSFGWLVVFLSLSGTGADFQCPSEWSAYGQHCYRAFSDLKTWEDAEKFCTEQEKAGHLVSIQSIQEANFVAQLVSGFISGSPKIYIWIGLRDRRKEQQCSSEWNDGSKVIYVNWREGESQMCQALTKWTEFHQWLNTDCAGHYPFICKSRV
uniref:Snaclec 3 n=1 Tax=Bitis gabonica TaxID=8694 RepID=SL3_BITGA|nr:RecName: Full=Snaclec 3; AltName: Full=C-type lectin 3; Flags: Precursor [Bitis gabonica]AAR06853.1 C-type lectin-3 [Bitis gabonica]